MIAHASPSDTTALIDKLKAAPFFRIYRDGFCAATGLPLELIAIDSSSDASTCNDPVTSPNENPFCTALNSASAGCAECKYAHKCVSQLATDRAGSHVCFAGLKESAVPVRLGNKVVGHLRTGQILTEAPTAEDISALTRKLRSAGLPQRRVEQLVHLYTKSPVIDETSYAGMLTILSAFALQLTALMNRIVLEARNSEPETVRKAKHYILEHLDEKLTLDAVAQAASVSTFYLCKIFKQSTGMTFTEFINRQRIERAKSALLSANRPITEIAYDVGYQSLSQFNRSFLKFVGESPTLYRRRMLKTNSASLVTAAA